MIQHAILPLGAKTMEQYVMLILDSGVTIIFFFQLMDILEKTHLFFWLISSTYNGYLAMS